MLQPKDLLLWPFYFLYEVIMLSAIQHSSSFKKTTETKASTSENRLPDSLLSEEELSSRLNLWMHQGGLHEKRFEAKRRILHAYQTQAEELRLNTLQLSELPPEIGQLRHLKSLCVWGNQLTKLPVEIYQLTNLSKLNLGRNLLITLPDEIGHFKQMRELNVLGNQIKQLPKTIDQLPFLEVLRINIPQTASPSLRSTQSISLRGFGALDGELVLPNLPLHLACIPECQQFFNAFSQQLNSHYFALQTLTASSLLEPEPTWTQTISSALQVFSILGSVITGEVVHNLAQQRARAEASEQALAMLGLFPTPLHFTATVRHAGVLFTERLVNQLQQSELVAKKAPTPPINDYASKLSRAYSTLQTKAGLQVEQPWERIHTARDMSTRFLKNLINNEAVHHFASHNNLNVSTYAKQLAEIVVHAVMSAEAGSSLSSNPFPLRRSYSDLSTLQSLTPQSTASLGNAELDLPSQIQIAISTALEPIQQQLEQLKLEVAQLKQENKALKQKLKDSPR